MVVFLATGRFVKRRVGTSRVRNLWFRALGVQMTDYACMRKVSIPRNWSNITIESPASLDDGIMLLCSGVDVSQHDFPN